MFYGDTAGVHDLLNDNPYNEGSYYWKQHTAKGETFEMEGLLSEDVLNIDKYVINGVDFDLKLYPSRSAFVLMSDSPQKEYRIINEEAILKCYTLYIGNADVSAHHKSLEHCYTQRVGSVKHTPLVAKMFWDKQLLGSNVLLYFFILIVTILIHGSNKTSIQY